MFFKGNLLVYMLRLLLLLLFLWFCCSKFNHDRGNVVSQLVLFGNVVFEFNFFLGVNSS